MDLFLKQLLTTHSVSGCEEPVREIIRNYASSWASEIQEDPVGNLMIKENYSENGIILAAHMDEIGLMITSVTEDGMLHVCKVGGIYVPMYFGHIVRIFTKKGTIYGSVAIKRDLYSKDNKPGDILIDIGAKNKNDALQYVSIGDVITLDSDCRELQNGRICGRNLDDKTGVYVITEALRRAKERGLTAPVAAVGTVGEETSQNGACWAAARLKPRMAIIVDVTYTSDHSYGSKPEDYGDIRLGSGPAICINPIINRKHIAKLQEIADKKHISLQYETSVSHTGTDADRIHYTGLGVEVLLVSIPLRYMHAASEIVEYSDMENCIELIAEYLLTLS